MEKYGWEFPSIFDPRSEEAGKLGVFGHPVTVLVDAEGRVVGGFSGQGTPEDWEELAAQL